MRDHYQINQKNKYIHVQHNLHYVQSQQQQYNIYIYISYMFKQFESKEIAPQVISESNYSSEQENIFGKDFAVDQITHPEAVFPNFHHYQNTGYEQCCVSCGNTCRCCFMIWNILCCASCNCCCCNFYYSLPTSKVGVVQQFGRFTRLLTPGFNYINPCSQQVLQIDMKLNNQSLNSQTVMTRDNIQLQVEATVYYRIINPLKVKYGLGMGNISNAIQEASIASIRNAVGEHTLEQILSTRSSFLETSKSILQKQLNNQGLQIEHFFLTQLFLPPEIQRNLSSAARQKRLGQAQIIYSHSNVISAKLMKESAQLLSTKAAMQIRYLQMLTEISNQNQQMTILIPIGVNKVGKVKK